MPFRVSDFISEINLYGTAKSSHFDVRIFGPAGIADFGFERSMSMRCFATSLPGRGVQTFENTHNGPPRKYAQNSILGDLSVNIIMSTDLKEKEYFERWIDMIVGNYRNENPNPDMYDLGFYDDYIGTVEISNYSENDWEVLRTTYWEVYPTQVGNLELSWGTTDLMTLPVTFTYKTYKNE